LKNIFWKNDEAVIYGKRITTKRKEAWYGDSDYSYSNTSKQTLPWAIELLDLRKEIEEIIDIRFNSCLLDLYNNSNGGV
jgi:alkylated DNA repair dioxygenase AlkB